MYLFRENFQILMIVIDGRYSDTRATPGERVDNPIKLRRGSFRELITAGRVNHIVGISIIK